jgi:hypothetical protein
MPRAAQSILGSFAAVYQCLLSARSGRSATPPKFPGTSHLSSRHGDAVGCGWRKKFKATCIIFVVAVTCLAAKTAVAQDTAEGKVLRVAVKPIVPFIFKHETELSGFSTDLWNVLAQSLKVETHELY